MTFTPNPHAINAAIVELSARKPGGGYPTPDDIALEANRRKWNCAPTIGSFEPSNQFIFWQAVEAAIKKRISKCM